MKKFTIAMLLGVMAISTGCGSDEATDTNEVVEDVVEEAPVVEGHMVIDGVALNVGANVTEDLIASLGEPVETMEAPSCHYDGNDTLYIYEDYTLYVYQDGEDNLLYIIELNTDAVATPDGAVVGMTRDEIFDIYGDAYEEFAYVSEFDCGDHIVAVNFDEEGVVSYIEIM